MDLRWMLRLYPRAWRERYEDEVSALLEERGATLATAIDLALGALDVHLDASILMRPGVPVPTWMPRVRSANRLVFWAFPLLMFFWSVLILDEADGPWDALRDTDPVVWAAWLATSVGMLAAVLTTIATGLLLAALRLRAPGSPAERVRRALPPILPPLLAGVALVAHVISLHLDQQHDFGAMPLFIVFWLSVLGLPVIVGRAVARDELSRRGLRVTLIAAAIVAAGMVAIIGGMVVSQVETIVVWPDGNWSVRLVLGLTLMMVPTAVAGVALRRGLSAVQWRHAD